MVSQVETLPLFCEPLSHSRDPVTSFEAAERLYRSGKLNGQCKAVFKALRSNSGATSAELAKKMSVDRHLPARRLPDLARQGLIERGSIRTCNVTHNPCVTWRLRFPLIEALF